MFSSTFPLVPVLLFGGLQLVKAQTTITAFAAEPAAGGDPVPTIAGLQGTGQFAPIGVLSDGKVVFTQHAVATIPGAGVGNVDGIAVEGSNVLEVTAVVTAQADGHTGVLNIGESCSFAAGAQATGNCAIVEDLTILGQGQDIRTATTIAVTRSDFTTLTVPTALPTLGDASLNLKKGGANGLRVTFASVLVGVAFGAAKIWL
ncbi:hypothetical protein MVEN_00678000 [Mycena venus]|uniref:Uncharacterized protein n=1 Tax=Mycena venus TaxID=2733690 RepID=A0A8H7D5P5_9AGAR|nr:hypothetical protein MVEN_00678000 [Mycena venus]